MLLCNNSRQDRRRRQPPRRRRQDNSDSESGDSRARPWSDYNSQTPRRSSNYQQHTRLPPFTGQETWKVYYNHFCDVADLQGWDDRDRLRELLPRLQGKAGEFVYDQLGRTVRTDFRQLVTELKNRFRKVETAKTFSAQFSRRSQHPGETVEEYAAELKRLYDKAHTGRDKEIRREDLVRRFMDGLLDDRAGSQVEFIREPEDIDTAVYEVVNYVETRRRTKNSNLDQASRSRKAARVRAVRGESPTNSTDGSGDSDADEEIRAIQHRQYGKGQRNPAPAQNKHASKPPPVTDAAQVTTTEPTDACKDR